MADSGLDLLFRLKAQNQASPAIKSVQGDIQKLRQTVGSEFGQMQQISTVALGRITSSLTNISSQVPVLGSAVNALTQDMTILATGTGQASAGLASMAGPAALVATGFIVTTVAVVKLGDALFDLAAQSAAFQGKLFDLSQQTGVSVETLSALEIAAANTGGNIDSISASLGIFQKNMEAAGDETSKQAKTFQQLNVTVSNTEDTLRDTLLALAAMPEGYRQTTAALELFGRGGKQVLAIIKETHGDLDLLIDKLRDAGLVTTEQARKADEFNDTLNALSFQLRGLGTQVIPLVTDALKDTSKFLKDNREAAELLRGSLAVLAAMFVGPFKGALGVAQVNIKAVTDALEFLGVVAKRPIVVGVEIRGRDSSGLELLKELKAAGAGKTIGPGLPDDDALIKSGLLKAKPKTAPSDPGIELLRQLSRELTSLTTTTRAQEIAAQLLDKQYKNLNPSLREQIDLIARTIDRKREQIEIDEKIARDAEEEARLTKQRNAEISSFLQSQRAEIDQLKGILPNAFAEAQKFVDALGSAISEYDKRVIRSNALTIQFLKDVNALADALANIELTPGPVGEVNTTLPNIADILGEDAPEAEERFRGLQAALDDLGTSLGNLVGAGEEFNTQFGDVIGGAISDLAFGIGDLVEQYVLLGETGPQALRKLLAATLAHLAAEAAVKAVFQLAEGFAALFYNPAEAAAHFTSAAIFGSIAGVAAVAGRGVAGDLFKPKSDQGRTTGGAGPLNTTITQGRNQPAPAPPPVFHVDIRHDEGVIVKTWADDFNNGGITREIMSGDGR